MAPFLADGHARFLFRTDDGRIDAKTWRRGTGLLLAVLAVLTAIWIPLEPLTHRDLASSPFFAWATIAAFVYLVFYAFAVLLIAICHYNLSAKRWRDRGWPSGLAGLLPLFALFSGAVHWLQPRVAEDVPYFYVAGIDLLLVGIILWNILELGVFDERSS
ncbi:hypothetical protein [Methylocapsa acidiphila]|uniref:hypothetical protein n=1 Tax=Methylocapsa acidiphila TaxID=133552 RepID=UPI00047EB78F|nr:hypothetical protein [Methylocapsa acidiphila]